jgi:hypothetical protein
MEEEDMIETIRRASSLMLAEQQSNPSTHTPSTTTHSNATTSGPRGVSQNSLSSASAHRQLPKANRHLHALDSVGAAQDQDYGGDANPSDDPDYSAL